MPRTITVKGVGWVSAKPNYIELSLSVYSHDQKYDQAMEKAEYQLEQLTGSVCSAGFEKDDLKTVNFDINTDYKNNKDRYGNSTRVFNGYVVEQDLKLGFDFNSDRLSKVLTKLAECLSNPKVSIRFTMKDPTAISEELLRSATKNAKEKANILCESADVELGELLSINYSWGELNVYSDTEFETGLMEKPSAKPISIEPEDIDVRDTATFVWEIK